MKQISFMFLFTIVWSTSFGQYLRTPSEIYKLADQSEIDYQSDTSGVAVAAIHYAVLKDIYLKDENDSLRVITYKTNKKSEKYRKKADKFKRSKKYHKAATCLEKAYKKDTSNAELIKELADLVGKTGEIRDAIKLYQRVLEASEYDYEAHFAISELLEKKGDHAQAINHMLLAHLYNRNDEVILDSMKTLFLRNDLEYTTVNFKPKYAISNPSDTVVLINTTDSTWHSYAYCKAIWKFEKDYSDKKKQISDQSIEIVQEKECLLCALITYEETKSEHPKIPEMKNLSSALLTQKIDQFLMYEHLLKTDPKMAYQLDSKTITKLKNYITVAKN